MTGRTICACVIRSATLRRRSDAASASAKASSVGCARKEPVLVNDVRGRRTTSRRMTAVRSELLCRSSSKAAFRRYRYRKRGGRLLQEEAARPAGANRITGCRSHRKRAALHSCLPAGANARGAHPRSRVISARSSIWTSCWSALASAAPADRLPNVLHPVAQRARPGTGDQFCCPLRRALPFPSNRPACRAALSVSPCRRRRLSIPPDVRTRPSVPRGQSAHAIGTGGSIIYKKKVIGVLDMEHTRINYFNEDTSAPSLRLRRRSLSPSKMARLYQRVAQQVQRLEHDLEMGARLQLACCRSPLPRHHSADLPRDSCRPAPSGRLVRGTFCTYEASARALRWATPVARPRPPLSTRPWSAASSRSRTARVAAGRDVAAAERFAQERRVTRNTSPWLRGVNDEDQTLEISKRWARCSAHLPQRRGRDHPR